MDPWVGKIPWRRERLTPIFWSGEFPWVSKSQTPLSDFHFHFFQTRLIKKKNKAPISKIKVSEKILYKMPEIFLKKEY